MSNSRATLPKIPAVEGTLKLAGEVYVPGDAIVLVADQLVADEAWPKLIQSVDPEVLSILYFEIGMLIEPWILRQNIDKDSFYQRSWIYINMSPQRHVAYAVTWFGLALALIIVYIAAATSRQETDFGTNGR